MAQRQRKNPNPLYVVTNKGRDIEQAESLVDALVKRFGLTPGIRFLSDVFSQILNSLLAQVYSYPLLVAAQQALQQLIHQFELLMARLGLGPVVTKNL